MDERRPQFRQGQRRSRHDDDGLYVASAANETVSSLEIDTGATLNITGGVFTENNSLGAFSNAYLAGVINIGAATKFVFGRVGAPSSGNGGLYGTGKVKIQGGALEIASSWFGNFGAHVVLSGNGEIIAINSGSSLNNIVGGVISGSGTIGSGMALQITNKFGATIDATGAAGSAPSTRARQSCCTTASSGRRVRSTLARWPDRRRGLDDHGRHDRHRNQQPTQR